MKPFTRSLAAISGLLCLIVVACAPTLPSVTPLPSTSPSPAAVTESPPAATPLPPPTELPTPGPDLATFFEDSFKQLLLRDPEGVIELGLAETLRLQGAHLTDISAAYVQETQALEKTTLDQLRAYDWTALPPEEQISAEVYAWYLDDAVRGQPFTELDYPVNQFINSIPTQLERFFSDLHAVRNRQEAQDYLTRLGEVDTKFEQLLAGLQRREAAGVILPRFLITWTLSDLRATVTQAPRQTIYYTAFRDKVNALADLSAEEQQALLAQAEQEIQTSVLPAYQQLVQYLAHLETVATNAAGIWKLPHGDAYYAYLLRHYTTTDLTADQIHTLGLQEVARLQAELRTRFTQLGYPADEALTTSLARAAEEGGYVQGPEILQAYEQALQEAQTASAPAFDHQPAASVIIKADPVGGYYIPPALDGSRPGAFYANVEGIQARLGIATLVHHETVPGHHLQLAWAQELDLPRFRTLVTFDGYVEGWALYAQDLMAELGYFDGDPYGDIGRLRSDLYRAARLVVDTGLHAQKWTYQQAVDYLVESGALGRGGAEYEVARYLVMPGQATSYYIGRMKLLELRAQAQAALGDRFDLRAFHTVVLGNGSVPLELLERLVDEYIATEQAKVAGLTTAEIQTLASLTQVDDYPLYTMHYYGDYVQSGTGDRRSTTASPPPAWACSLFAALGDPASRLYGRNFDWDYSPALLLYTDPPNGYASISSVDIAYLVDADKVKQLTTLPLAERQELLGAPALPFDGMNETGLAIGMAAVPAGNVPADPAKPTLDSLAVMREVLDHASTVAEAVALLQQYNIDWDGGPPLHYLIADRSGYATLVEFYAGQVVLIPNEQPWHQATNFLRAAAGDAPTGECWRYDRLNAELTATGGRLTAAGALKLLSQVTQEGTQWSVVYGLSTGVVTIAMHQQYEPAHTFTLPLSQP